eukprot:2295752-Alexandrium_andersonii.AAC.1
MQESFARTRAAGGGGAGAPRAAAGMAARGLANRSGRQIGSFIDSSMATGLMPTLCGRRGGGPRAGASIREANQSFH